MKYITIFVATAALLVAAMALPSAAAAQAAPGPSLSTVASGIQGASGSTIGPDGALYVTESQTGRILRIDPGTGASSTFASGLPVAIAPIGGPMDLVFQGGTAYVLVSLVGEFFGSPNPSGIYRMDGPSAWTVIADLGTWAIENPPSGDLEYEITTGVHYAIDLYQGGFVVSDAHHNKVIHVTAGGDISLLEEYDNTVPAGLATVGNQVLIAMSGATPHLAEDGQIVAHRPNQGSTLVAAGGPLLVDVELGPSSTVLGLAQGFFTPGQDPGSPADPHTGELLLSDGVGGFEPIFFGLDRPTSFEVIGTTVYVVEMSGDLSKLDDISGALGGAAGDPSGALAFTGSSTQLLALVGAALLAAGALTVSAGRRVR